MEVAGGCVTCGNQAKRTAVAAYLNGGAKGNLGRETDAQMLTEQRTTLEIWASQGSPLKKGTSQAPCPWAMATPLKQRRISLAAEQHCS